MPKGASPPLTDEQRAQMKRWLDNWARVGHLLDEERWSRVAALTNGDAVRSALDLWRMAIPGHGDDGEGLRTLKQLASRRRSR